MARYARPTLPYEAQESLPYNNRYVVVSSNEESLKGDELDADINYVIDSCNELYQTIQGIQAGILPGSALVENRNKIFSTNGQNPPTLFWAHVTEDYLADNEISSQKLKNSCVIREKIANASVNADKIADDSITLGKYADLSINGSKVADDSIPFNKIEAKADDDFIRYVNLQNDDSIQGGKLLNDSVNGSKITPNTIPETKYADGSVSRRALAEINREPIGCFKGFAGTAAPAGYLFCNGQAVSRDTYSLLFGAIGTNWGPGDGNTTFNVPDFRGRTIFGIDPAHLGAEASTNGRITHTPNNNYQIGGNGGEELHTLTIPEIPAHSHDYTSFVVTTGRGGMSPYDSVASSNVVQTSENGGGQQHNNMPPYALSPYIIYTGV